MTISFVQTIHGRAVTSMLRAELSAASGVSVKAIKGFEEGERTLNLVSLQALRAALERAGWDGSDVLSTSLRGITMDPRDEGLGDQLE